MRTLFAFHRIRLGAVLVVVGSEISDGNFPGPLQGGKFAGSEATELGDFVPNHGAVVTDSCGLFIGAKNEDTEQAKACFHVYLAPIKC